MDKKRQEFALVISKSRVAAFCSASLIKGSAFNKSLITSCMWSSVQWKSSYYFSEQPERQCFILSLRTEYLASKNRMTSYWKAVFGFWREGSVFGWTCDKWSIKWPGVRMLLTFHFISFLLSIKEKETTRLRFQLSAWRNTNTQASNIPSNFSGTTQVSS